MTPPLEPGVHAIVANAVVAENPVGPASVRITVAPRNEQQQEFAKLVAGLPPIEEPLKTTEGDRDR